VNTRGSLVPDPTRDPISSIFWCIQSADGTDRDSGVLTTEQHFPIGPLRHFDDIDIRVETEEAYLINALVDVVRELDPDILTGYEVHSSSWGYVIERVMHLNGEQINGAHSSLN
jgi:DNA polymerase zeta